MLDELKDYLTITWEDETLDRKLQKLLNQSQKSLNKLMGVECDFENDEEFKELLFNRVRYAYNNSIEYFESNFAKEILRLQLMAGVDKLEE